MKSKRTKFTGLQLLEGGTIIAGVHTGAHSELPDMNHASRLRKESVPMHDEFPRWFQRHIELLERSPSGNVFNLKVK